MSKLSSHLPDAINDCLLSQKIILDQDILENLVTITTDNDNAIIYFYTS